jgi:hypothetical protein
MLAQKRFLVLIASALMMAVALPAAPASAQLRADADWREAYFPSADGVTQLHADILTPKGMPIDGSVKTPVILTVSPYVSHNGQTTDTDLNGTGPSNRFYDFLDLSGVLTKGYSYVMVDLPGFGGSAGCNDWGGTREQLGVRAAVEWAASQPWSSGKVALLGKSYDGWTGLMGIGQQPEGLAAVVSMEPVYDGYRYIWMNGVRRSATVGTVGLFQAIDAKPGRPGEAQYNVNGAPEAWCYGVNIAGAAADDDPNGPYWQDHNLIPTAIGKTTPLFLTQGFLELNTRPDGAFQYFNNLAGTENHAWFGQFDHFRGWEKGSGIYQLGRSTYIEEVMRFLDEHLKGIEPAAPDPTIEVQDILGRYRAEDAWPPADSHLYETSLKTGTYTDSGSGSGLQPSQTQGIWTVSTPLPHDVWLAGEPVITVGVDAVPNANMAANVYDVSEEGELTMISRGVSLLRGTGRRTTSYTMYGQDWPIPAGHRIAVLISPADTNEFTHVATRTTVTIRSAKIGLPFLTYDRTQFLPSDGTTPRLESYVSASKTTLTETTITGAEKPFNLPGPLQPNPAEA